MRRKKELSLETIEELDDETYYYIQFLHKQIDELNHKIDVAEETLNRTLDLINSNEDFAYFYSSKTQVRKPIEEYFKKTKSKRGEKNETKR